MTVRPQTPGEPEKESLLHAIPENSDVSKPRFYVISRTPQRPRYTETREFAALGQANILYMHCTLPYDAYARCYVADAVNTHELSIYHAGV